jgi:phosphatidylserine synthase
MRWRFGPFGIKDLFTMVNLMGGVGAIVLTVRGCFNQAGIALLAGYLLGDTLDGPVARRTKTSNAFGSELDTATDHFTQAIAPAVLVYAVYAHGGHGAAGVALMSVIVACATIRQALFSVAKMGDPLMYCGLPRTVSGYGSAAYVLSRFFFGANPHPYATGAVLISAFALLNLFPIPYMTHRGRRRMQTYVRLLVLAFLVTPVAALVLAPRYVFDVLFIWMFGYAALAWLPIYPEEKRAFYARYRAWAQEVSRV